MSWEVIKCHPVKNVTKSPKYCQVLWLEAHCTVKNFGIAVCLIQSIRQIHELSWSGFYWFREVKLDTASLWAKDGRFRLRNRSRNRLQIWPIWNRSRNRNQLFIHNWNRSQNRNQNNGPESEPEPCIMDILSFAYIKYFQIANIWFITGIGTEIEVRIAGIGTGIGSPNRNRSQNARVESESESGPSGTAHLCSPHTYKTYHAHTHKAMSTRKSSGYLCSLPK